MSPKLKLHTGSYSGSPNNASAAPEGGASSVPPTPGSGRIILKIGASQPPTPATHGGPEQGLSTASAVNQPGKAGQPAEEEKKNGKKGKGGGSKKRAANDDTISPVAKRPANASIVRKPSISIRASHLPRPNAAGGVEAALPSSARPHKLMLKRKSTGPKLKALNAKRLPPPRYPGHGYDSEDSEAEEDPAIQQSLILRMQPGEDCDYLRDAITNGKIGLPPSEGAAEVSLRFLDKDGRRATVTIRGRMYAAALVDLPCIVETMKSWDKKGWYKVSDLSQMLLVLGRCTTDDEAKNYPLPRDVDKETLQYAHGLTPPMHSVRKRRFRKRVSYKTIANVEEEVERLLKEDEDCERQGGEVTMEYLDRAELERSQEPDQYDDEDMADADGEAIETVENGDQYEEYSDEEDVDLEAMEANLQAMFDEERAPPAATDLITESPATLVDQSASFAAVENAMQVASPSAAETPAQTPAGEETQESASDESGESDEDASDDEESPDVMDEDAAAKLAERNQQLEEVADLEREVEAQRRKVGNMKNQLLKERAVQQLKVLEEDLRVKRGVFGFDEGEGEGDEA